MVLVRIVARVLRAVVRVLGGTTGLGRVEHAAEDELLKIRGLEPRGGRLSAQHHRAPRLGEKGKELLALQWNSPAEIVEPVQDDVQLG